MQTTLALKDDANATVQASARAHAITSGQTISEPILRGSAGKVPMRQTGGVWVFDLPADTPHVAAAQVKQLLDEFP